MALGTATWVRAQSTDSLNSMQQLKKSKDTLKSDIAAAEELARQALSMARQANYHKGQIRALSQLGQISFKKGDYTESLRFYHRVDSLLGAEQQSEAYVQMQRGISDVKLELGFYEEAFEHLALALKAAKTRGDTSLMGPLMSAFGNLYFYQQNYRQAFKYYRKSLQLNRAIGEPTGVGNSYNNLASTFHALHQPDSSMYYLEKANAVYRKLNDRGRLSVNLNNLSILARQQGSLKKSQAYVIKALALNKALENQKGMGENYLSLAALKSKRAQFDSALYYASRSLQLARTIENTDLERQSLNVLSGIFEEMGMHKQSLHFYRLYQKIEDSLVNAQFNTKMAEMQSRLNFELKEKENQLLKKQQALLEEKARRRNVYNYALAGGVALSFFSLFLLFNRYRVKEKSNRALEERNAEIILQRDDIQAQSQELQRAYFAIQHKNRKITDSIHYARRIQRALSLQPEVMGAGFADHFVFFFPKDIVSGDFYWGAEIGQKQILIVADCTGHGVPGAFMTMLGNTYLNDLVHEKQISEPAELLYQIQWRLKEQLADPAKEEEDSEDGIDLSVLVRQGNEAAYAGMKNSLVHIRAGELMEYRGNRTAHKMMDQQTNPFSEEAFALKPGDRLFMFTDGYPDQFGGEKGRKFMVKRLRELLLSSSDQPLQKQYKELEQTFLDWKGSYEQTDDILLVGWQV